MLLQSLFALLLLVSLHLFSVKEEISHWKKKLFSFSGGISLAYVFVDLLPKLSKGETAWQTSQLALPFLEKYIYFFTLLGVLFFLGIERLEWKDKNASFWTSAIGSVLFNVLIGYAIANPRDPETQPFLLFLVAISLHLYVRDHILALKNPKKFHKLARFLLGFSLVLGWTVGKLVVLHPTVIFSLFAFLGGGLMISLFHSEIPFPSKSVRFLTFALGALFYSFLLLFLGAKSV